MKFYLKKSSLFFLECSKTLESEKVKRVCSYDIGNNCPYKCLLLNVARSVFVKTISM